MVSAAEIWLSSPPSITVRTCHIIINELNTTNMPDSAKDNTDNFKNKFATTPVIMTIAPIVKNLPKACVLIFFARRAITAIVKKMAEVMIAATVINLPPSIADATANKGVNNKPIPKVKTINNAIPT